MRNVSMDSPFEPRNLPPVGHLKPDAIMDKPCRINMLSVPKNTKPLAGRLTEIGKHRELLAQNGIYAELCRSQVLGGEP